MNNLTLSVDCVLGTDIQLCVEDAIDLARKLGLGYVTFSANDFNYTCYSNGTAMKSHWGGEGRWEYAGGGKWKFFPPITGAINDKT